MKFRKPEPQPIIAFAKAEDFNQTVLSTYMNGNQICSTYTSLINSQDINAALIITSKSMSTKALIKNCIAIFVGAKKDL